MKKQAIYLPILLIGIAALSRLLPHPPNFTPVGAMALMGGAYLGKKYMKYLIPLAALFFSDLILNNTVLRAFFPEVEGFVLLNKNMIWVYAGFIAMIALGTILLKKISAKNVIIATLAVSLIFFIITNLGVWLGAGYYPKTFAGLIACFGAAIPFFLNTLIGNFVFSGVLFGIMEYTSSRKLDLERV